MSITSANAVFMMTIPGIFPAPVQLQNFAADDIFDTDQMASAETVMGVDGIMTAGFVFVPVHMGISLQADSASNVVFDTWWAVQQQVKDVFYAYGNIILPATGAKYALIKGSLTAYKPLPDAKRTLHPRKYGITWQQPVPTVV